MPNATAFQPKMLVIQGPGLPNAQRQAGGMLLKLEDLPQSGMHMSGVLRRKQALQMPADNNDELAFWQSTANFVFVKPVTIRIVGTRIDELIAQLQGVETFEQVGAVLKGLLDYCKENILVISS